MLSSHEARLTSSSKTVLGRGLASLIPRERLESPPLSGRSDDGSSTEIIAMVDLDRVERNPYQPRTDFDTESLEELKRSIQAKGVIQPITVRRVERGYQLISGERRVRAAREAGLKQIPAYILRVDSNEDMLELALIENLQREDLNPLEVAVGYRRLIEECNLTQEQVSEKVGKDRSTVANFLRLLKLPETIQVAVREGKISGGHARALAGLERQDIQLAIFRRVLEKGLSVRDTERLARAATTSGKNPRGGRSLPPGGSRDTALSNIEERLRQVLGTKVVVRSGEGGKGEIVIEFYSPDDLDRLLDMFAEIDNNVH